MSPGGGGTHVVAWRDAQFALAVLQVIDGKPMFENVRDFVVDHAHIGQSMAARADGIVGDPLLDVARCLAGDVQAIVRESVVPATPGISGSASVVPSSLHEVSTRLAGLQGDRVAGSRMKGALGRVTVGTDPRADIRVGNESTRRRKRPIERDQANRVVRLLGRRATWLRIPGFEHSPATHSSEHHAGRQKGGGLRPGRAVGFDWHRLNDIVHDKNSSIERAGSPRGGPGFELH